jgi:hypothetical protein
VKAARLKELDSIKDQIFKRAKVDGSLIGFANDAIRPSHEAVSLQAKPGEPTADTWITGRLFNFDAPGGKLRTVAICDYWTQVCMKSVHDHLFKILKVLWRNDATFDQQGTVDRYFAEGFKPHWSFDLSAATDSIPLSLYIECLAPLLKQKGETYEKAYLRAQLWSRLMTERDFHIPSPKKGETGYTGNRISRTIRYATGQPMGAYSSWASMALVHHALVQFASWLNEQPHLPGLKSTRRPLGMPRWFNSYLVLGDDVDIARCDITANNYQVACEAFHIKIGLAKSLRSKDNFFEFANQRFCEEGNISPLSLSEELSSSETWNRRVEYVSRISKRFGIAMNEINLVRLVLTSRQWTSLVPEFSGLRPKVLVRLLRFILLNPLKPNWHSGQIISIEAVLIWLAQLQELILTTASAEVWNDLESHLADRIREMVMTDVKRRMDSIPPSRSMFSHEGAIARAFELVGKKRMANYEFFVPKGAKYVSITRGKAAKYAISYIQSAVNLFNEDLRKQLASFKNTHWRLLAPQVKTQPEPEKFWWEDAKKHSPGELGKWLKLWLELGNFPEPIAMDSKGFAACLRTEPSGKVQAEHAESLLKVILPFVAETLGHRVAGIPYYPLKGASGGAWYRLMKRCFKQFETAKAAADSNPAVRPGILNAVRSKLGRVEYKGVNPSIISSMGATLVPRER